MLFSQPFETYARPKWVHLPQGSGCKFPKICELPPASNYKKNSHLCCLDPPLQYWIQGTHPPDPLKCLSFAPGVVASTITTVVPESWAKTPWVSQVYPYLLVAPIPYCIPFISIWSMGLPSRRSVPKFFEKQHQTNDSIRQTSATTTLFQISGQCGQLRVVNMTWQSTWRDIDLKLVWEFGVQGWMLSGCQFFFEDTWTILAPFVDHLSKIAFHYSAESRHIVGHGTTTKMSTRPQVFPTKLCLTKPQNFWNAMFVSWSIDHILGIKKGIGNQWRRIHWTCQKT